VAPPNVRDLTLRLLDIGVDQVAIGDTIGAAAPNEVHDTVGEVLRSALRERIALHFHDTFGTALANVYAGLSLGVETFDSSAGGLGGCPFAPGAVGNLATEDLVYVLDRLGIECGVRLNGVEEAAEIVADALGHRLSSWQWRRIRGAAGRGSDPTAHSALEPIRSFEAQNAALCVPTLQRGSHDLRSRI
jgi:hydroxymethylglutaryl-CoA lyase